MKYNLASSIVIAALLALPSLASAQASSPTDRAAELLARNGSVRVNAAGPYVQTGTFAIQVAAKLGQPSARLVDGTWLYHNHALAGSDARGTLIVRFNQGRVSELTLVTPAVAAALITPKSTAAQTLAANRQ